LSYLFLNVQLQRSNFKLYLRRQRKYHRDLAPPQDRRDIVYQAAGCL